MTPTPRSDITVVVGLADLDAAQLIVNDYLAPLPFDINPDPSIATASFTEYSAPVEYFNDVCAELETQRIAFDRYDLGEGNNTQTVYRPGTPPRTVTLTGTYEPCVTASQFADLQQASDTNDELAELVAAWLQIANL